MNCDVFIYFFIFAKISKAILVNIVSSFICLDSFSWESEMVFRTTRIPSERVPSIKDQKRYGELIINNKFYFFQFGAVFLSVRRSATPYCSFHSLNAWKRKNTGNSICNLILLLCLEKCNVKLSEVQSALSYENNTWAGVGFKFVTVECFQFLTQRAGET